MNLRLLGLLGATLISLSLQTLAMNVGTTAAAAAATNAASIGGRITYTDGRPVTRYPVDYRPASNRAAGDSVRTDGEGRYVISGLADGVYFVGFFHPDRLPPDRNPRVETLPDPSPELIEIGAPKGQRVVIANGQSVDSVDFVLTDVGAEKQSTEGVEVGPDELGLPESGGFTRTASDGISGVAIATLVSLGITALALGGWSLVRKRDPSD